MVKYLFVLISCVQVAQAAGYFKCVKPGGVISYQEKPCKSADESTLSQQGVSDAKDLLQRTVIHTTHLNRKPIRMALLDWWDVRSWHENKILNLKITDGGVGEPFRLLVTGFPLDEEKNSSINQASMRASLQEVINYELEWSKEKSPRINSIQSELGAQILFTQITDRRLLGKKQYPEGEFLYKVIGQIKLDGGLMIFTLLSNDFSSENHELAFRLVTETLNFEEPSQNKKSKQQGTLASELTEYQKGMEAVKYGEMETAAVHFEKAASEEPNNIEYLMAHCLALREVNRLTMAILKCQRIKRLQPDHPHIDYRLLNLYIKARLYNQAWSLARSMWKSQKSEALFDAINNLAYFAMVDGKLDMAGQSLKMIQSSQYVNNKFSIDLAIWLYLNNHVNEALKSLGRLTPETEIERSTLNAYKKKMIAGQNVFVMHENQEHYALVPTQALETQGVEVLVPSMETKVFPVKGVAELQIKTPENWFSKVHLYEITQKTNQLKLLLYPLDDSDQVLLVFMRKYPMDWGLEQLKQSINDDLDIFVMKGFEIELEPMSEQADIIQIKAKPPTKKQNLDTRILGQLQNNIGLITVSMMPNGRSDLASLFEQVVEGIALLDIDDAPITEQDVAEFKKTQQKRSVKPEKHEFDRSILTDLSADFEWFVMDPVLAAIKKPIGWFDHFQKMPKGSIYAFSPTPLDDQGHFKTGFTLLAYPNLTQWANMSAYNFITEMALHIQSDPNFSVISQSQQSRGNLQSIIIRYEDRSIKNDLLTIHKVMMANQQTGSVYIFLFEAPSDAWNSAWETGEIMMNFIVDDEF